jgi:hypothetical protein
VAESRVSKALRRSEHRVRPRRAKRTSRLGKVLLADPESPGLPAPVRRRKEMN